MKRLRPDVRSLRPQLRSGQQRGPTTIVAADRALAVHCRFTFLLKTRKE
mgnify:CR=1 FL=1